MEKFVVDKNICIGCGACTAVASDTFEIDDDGLAKTIEGKEFASQLNEEEKNNAMDALEGCPVDAIKLEKEENSHE